MGLEVGGGRVHRAKGTFFKKNYGISATWNAQLTHNMSDASHLSST